jgi:hypothetical protein
MCRRKAAERSKQQPEPLEVGFGRDVALDRIEPPGYSSNGHSVLSPGVSSNALGCRALDVGVRERIRQRQAVSHSVVPFKLGKRLP